MSTIPLAKGFSEKHLRFPVLLSRKFDGVPIRIDIDLHGNHTVRTRQGKDVPSVRNLVQEFIDRYLNEERDCDDVVTPLTLVGEVVQHGNWDADFKETSGIVRQQTDQSHRLAIMLFECAITDDDTLGFIERHQWMEDFLGYIHGRVQVIEQVAVENMEHLQQHQQEFNRLFPKAEGMVARNHDDPWAPGKRSWGYQKVLNEPTIDLWIVGCEEAIDKDGNPKGMVGRLIASYKGKHIGVGPGRMNHIERALIAAESGFGLWNGPRMAQIKYKADDSYDALRQPTFQHWRDDKETPDA